ncbi:MAG: ATP-binding protein [Candidatus Cloacimonetes bacterium]|jgi:two-component system, NtrC family, nitrogen regulation sensor histidine kinase NtrY|nr:ATP-binding protein [Candidatus Cloacimonadota bacterium]MBT4332735.1 ATP-binding protein [Candidatus Cloacimonadota bacterium]MBT4576406.1 ATP-binding protein [Candidatus Cloacimonadota bacterium]MBT5421174.1 ATP-binding protein [Candidatus Cloacimonadota bacterium]
MVYKNFKVHTVVRIVLIILMILAVFISIYSFGFNVTPILLGTLIIFQVFDLIKYVQKTNRYLTSFLESIRYADFSRSFRLEGLGSAYDEMKDAFNDVIADFQKIRTEKEEHYHYLQNVIQHIGISLIAFQKDGSVEMINNSAKKLFQVSKLKNIKDLQSYSSELVEKLQNMKTGERTLVQVTDNDMMMQLAVYATEFKIRMQSIILVSIQNIQSELEEQEMEAWQKLIRVLTHEIMNSITPIASLSSTINELLKDIDTTDNIPQMIDDDTIIDIRNSLKTISKRSTGLVHFVESYRNLTKIPKPKFDIVLVSEIFNNVHLLMEKDLMINGVECVLDISPPSLELTADEELIEQVLINIVKNAIHVLSDTKDAKIVMRAFLDKRGKIALQVIDNGPGILKEVIDKIFVPFFTTKPDGSGIGLSLSKQIMRMHGGTLTAQSEQNVETNFTLRF